MTGAGDSQEADLVRRFREGDQEAFRVLFERYEGAVSARIRRCLPARLRRRVAVSDVLQESCMVAFERRSDLAGRGAEAFRNWLLGIVEMKAREAFRHHAQVEKRSARREVTRAERGETAAFSAGGPTPSQVAIGAELKDLARRAMLDLPSDYREILRLAQEERLNLKEASERMGRSHAAVRQLYGRALCRFREAFENLKGETDA